MTAEERRTLPVDAPHEQDAAPPHPAEPQPHDPYAPQHPQHYAQYEPDPYARPQPQDLDAVAAAQPQPQQYAEQPYAEQTAAPQPYEPAQYAPEPQAAETYAAQYHEQPAEPQHAQYAPQEPTVDLSYPPPPPLTEDDLREPALNEMPMAVNENRRVEIVREPRSGVGAATWIITAIAVLSLGVMTYQTYVFQRGIAAMQNNAARGQFVVACRDSIGSYYEARQKVSVLMPAADRSNVVGASRVTEYNRLEAQAAIAKLSSIVSYLASFQDPGTRVRYTELTRSMNGVMDVARTTPLSDIDRVFSPADKLFAGMNEDCARLSQSARF